ncbi:MAG: hypothetical protein IT452_12760 [Planctomycetia bacterium]|nr:hypothetical protein [Planctomycetia bacterium]
MRVLRWIWLGLVVAGCSKSKEPPPVPARPAQAGDELLGKWLLEGGGRTLEFHAHGTLGPPAPGQESALKWSIPAPGTVRVTKGNGKTEDATYEVTGGKLVIRAGGEENVYVRPPAGGGSPAPGGEATAAKLRLCQSNVLTLSMEVELHRFRRKKLPSSLQELAPAISDPRKFRCPCTEKDDAYVIVQVPADLEKDPDALLLHDRDAHADGRRSVASMSGRIYVLTEEEFEAAASSGKIVQGR